MLPQGPSPSKRRVSESVIFLRSEPMRDAPVRARPRAAVIVFDVLCFSPAARTIAVLLIKAIRAEPSEVMALIIVDLSFIFMTMPFFDFWGVGTCAIRPKSEFEIALHPLCVYFIFKLYDHAFL